MYHLGMWNPRCSKNQLLEISIRECWFFLFLFYNTNQFYHFNILFLLVIFIVKNKVIIKKITILHVPDTSLFHHLVILIVQNKVIMKKHNNFIQFTMLRVPDTPLFLQLALIMAENKVIMKKPHIFSHFAMFHCPETLNLIQYQYNRGELKKVFSD